MNNQLNNKVAIVTGGARGIGLDISKNLASSGAKVYALGRSENMNVEDSIIYRQCDVSNLESVQEVFKSIQKEAGSIDILVNNAGITRDTLMLRMTEEHWDQVIQTNLKSIFNLTKHVLRPMMKNRGGSIINMSSIVGITGNAGQANYAASKAGIFGFTKSIAQEMGSRNIRCNAIAPGFIETDMTDQLDEKTKENYLTNIPLKRLGKASEIADSCVFFGSDLSSYVSGQTLSVCGALNC